MAKAKPLYRLRRLLRRAQLLFLLLSVVYVMGGSILLLQRSSTPIISPWPDANRQLSPPPSMAPQAGWQQGGSGSRRPLDVQVTERSGRNAEQVLGRVISRSLNRDRRVLRRHMFRNQVTQSQPSPLSSPIHGPVHHKGTHMGCFIDDAQTHTLGGTVLYDFRKMTPALCQDTCSESGYQYAGLAYGAECHCGNRIAGPQTRLEECNLDCKGEKGAPCGGVERLSVYKLDKKPPGQRKYSSLHYRGCYKKPYDPSASLLHITESDSTLEACVKACTEKEYPLAAVSGPSCLCLPASARVALHTRVEKSRCLPGNRTTSTGAPHLQYYQVYHTPAVDARCRERMFLSESSTPLVALASFPGAGNTWVRHLIELSTGYYTGSFYFDGALFNGGFKGEKDYWKKGRTICVKTHESGQRDIEMFDAGILILRNPYHSLVAEFNRKCGGHVGYASERHWRSKDWPEFVESHASWWVSHALAWLRFSRQLLVVHFEELQARLLPQLRVITSFLNASVSDDRLLCAESNSDGLFKRSGPRKPTFDPYTPSMRELINGYILTVDQALRHRNLSGLPKEYMPR